MQLDGVTLEQALNQILTMNQLSYKVLTERSILDLQDTAQKHQAYDDQVIQTFYLSNADATELAQLLSQAFRPAGHRGPADDRAEQGAELDHDPRHGAGRRRSSRS